MAAGGCRAAGCRAASGLPGAPAVPRRRPGARGKAALRLAWLLALLLPGAAPAGPGLAAQEAAAPGDELTLKLAVIGPGDELYFWWGHIGLIIEDNDAGTARFYDWGIFSFDQDDFFTNFAFGRLLYCCGASPALRNIAVYRATNRDVTLYTLNLPADKKDEIRRFAEWNILPENRDYFYHHFRNNCVTPLLNILDEATGGAFRARYETAPGRLTLRQHVRRHMAFNPFFDWLLNFLMGRDIDQPITVWEEMFLPSEVALRAREFSYTGADGVERPLVSAVEVLNEARGRPAVLDQPRPLWPLTLAVGAAAALLLSLARLFGGRGRRAAAAVWALGQGVWGLALGCAGTVLFFMTFFTNHDYTYHNINLLFVNPLLLAALPLGILSLRARSRERRVRWTRWVGALWGVVLVLGLATLVINVFYGQDIAATVALVLPTAAAFALAALTGGRRPLSK